jgi:hypothetical protein
MQIILDRSLTIGACLIANGVIAVVIGAFAGMHIMMIIKGYTTLEYTEKRNGICLGTPYSKSPFRSATSFEALQRVFGTSPMLWLIPTRMSVPGDGMHFPNVDAHISDNIDDNE